MYGLQLDFINKVLDSYFGSTLPNKTKKSIWLGFGLKLQGATENIDDFDEVFTGENESGYKRARVTFGQANDNLMVNTNTVIFPTAIDDWTKDTRKIESVGIFDTDKYYYDESESSLLDKALIKPLVVLKLPMPIEIKKGETAMLEPGVVVMNLSDM